MTKVALKHAWLGLGGNIGDVKANMAAALQILEANSEIELFEVSPIYKTPPWGMVDQDWFLNCAVNITTGLDPEALLDACLATELVLKRERIVRWGPRSIDVDLLLYQGVEQVSDKLTLPHPRMHERTFVLKPLADISPDLVINGKSVVEWLNAFDSTGIEDHPSADGWYLEKTRK